MKITFLGTAAAEGYPSPFCDCPNCVKARELGGKNIRKRTAALINDDLLVDMGPDVPAACGMYGISLNHIKYNLITHSHADHFYPNNLRMRVRGFRRESPIHPLQLTAGPSTFNVFGDGDGDDTQLDLTRVPVGLYETFRLPPYTIKSLAASHFPQSGDAMNYIIDDGCTKLLYACDTGLYEEKVFEEMTGHAFDLIVIESTVTLTDHQQVHLNYPGVLSMLKRMEEIGSKTANTKVYITHFSHQGNPTHEELEQLYGQHGYVVTYDGMVIEAN